MIELIDREATVKQICKMGEMLGVGHARDVTIAVALFVQDDKSAFPTIEAYTFEQVQDLVALNKKLSEEIPQWIPCTDRLPEKTGYYLVSDRRGDVYSTNFDYLRGEMCFGYDDLDGCFIKDDTVIAWMPLPTPYMKDGEKDAKDPGNR